jgi:hypothetical protein
MIHLVKESILCLRILKIYLVSGHLFSSGIHPLVDRIPPNLWSQWSGEIEFL